MAHNQYYEEPGPTRDEVDGWAGPAVLHFGANWCGICAGARPDIEEAFADHPDLKHVKVEDGPGRALGRSFRVKLWPTLIFLKDGREVARAVRPSDADEVRRGIESIVGGGSD